MRPADEPPAPEAEDGTNAVDSNGGGEPFASGAAASPRPWCAAARTQGDEALHGAPEPDEDEPDDGGRLPERLMTELTAHRTLALRATLSADPEVQAEHDRLRAEADAIEADYATAEDMPEAADRTLTALEARLAEIAAEARAFYAGRRLRQHRP